MLRLEVIGNEDGKGILSELDMFLLLLSPDRFVLENHETRIIDVVATMVLSPLPARCEGGGGPAYRWITEMNNFH
jgi:hypothetical protein